MKLVIISDTHSYHRSIKVPDGDTLVCAGDITFRGELIIFADFFNWLRELPHKNKVLIFGNHELGIQSGPNRGPVLQMLQDAGGIYLENSGTTIDGINFYGSPNTPWFHDWAWNLPRDGKELKDTWARIPENTNILITHGPPYGILDGVNRTPEPQGCKLLKKRVMRLPNLKVHAFGHLHHDGGKMVTLAGVQFVNAAICTDSYMPTNIPRVIEV